MIVYYHGGGWVIATLDTYDASCRALANLARCVVVSVDYRQALEHKFPAAHEDAYAAAQWVMKNAKDVGGDPKRVAVGGESAGGNLAAAVCLMARDRKGRCRRTSCSSTRSPITRSTPSYQANAEAKPLDRKMMQWFFQAVPAEPVGRAEQVRLAAARDDADVRELPPATVITADIDPLMSEGKAYADKLKAAGTDVAYRNYDGVTHEFFGMAAVVDKAKAARRFAADRLKAAFDTGAPRRRATAAGDRI